MPKREGSGPQGTSELLSVGKPLLAALNLTPIGRGILGAVGTMATIPEETEAGIFTNVAMVKNLKKIKLGGMAVLPDKVVTHEIPTAHWTGAINTDNMATAIQKLGVGNVSSIGSKPKKAIMARAEDMRKAKLVSVDKFLAKSWDMSDSTSAVYGHREPKYYPYGVVGVRNTLPDDKMVASLVHEYTHLNDDASPITNAAFIGASDDIPYEKRLTEVKAFLAGSRAGFPDKLTNPESTTFVHPLISYTNGKFSNEPLKRYFDAMKAGGVKYDIKEVNTYAFEIQKEIDRLTEQARVDPVFRRTLDVAVENVPLHYESWVFSQSQTKARGKARVEAYREARDNKE